MILSQVCYGRQGWHIYKDRLLKLYLGICETFLDNNTDDNILHINGFNLERKNVWSEYDFYFIAWSEKMYISWVPKARMKNTFFHFTTFISSREMKKCTFHECRRHEWKIHFFTSRDEIKVIFTTNIWIFFLLYTSLSIGEMQILHLQGEVWHAVLSLGGDI